MSAEVFRRTVRNNQPVNWNEVTDEWHKLFGKNAQYIIFPDFLTVLKQAFQEEPDVFLAYIKHSHKIEPVIPDNFEMKSAQEQSNIFFSFFQKIFTISELGEFVKQADIGPDNIKSNFTRSQYILFSSISSIYLELLGIAKENLKEKYGLAILTIFSKLLIPKEAKIFYNKDFKLDTVYISPAYYHSPDINKMAVFVNVLPTGTLEIIKAQNFTIVTKIEPKTLSIIQDADIVEFYGSDIYPILTLKFPSDECANTVLDLYLETPPQGFNHMTTFLRSLEAFDSIDTFFTSENKNFPLQLMNPIEKIINMNGCEVLLYLFCMPKSEAKAIEENPLYAFSLLEDKFLPFLRAIIELYFIDSPSGNISTILRSDNQLMSLITALLRATSYPYLEYIVTEFTAIMEKNGSQLKSTNFTHSDAKFFCEKIFMPCFSVLINSVPNMTSSIKYILRTFFIRAACHYPNERAATLVIPDILLQRFIIPEFTARNKANAPLVSLLCNSLMSLFYMSGWPANKAGKQLMEFSRYMTDNYDRVGKFTRDVIECKEYLFNRVQVETAENNQLTDFIKNAAKRCSLMNLTTPNSVIHSHMYSVSVMQMLEELTYDFSLIQYNQNITSILL